MKTVKSLDYCFILSLMAGEDTISYEEGLLPDDELQVVSLI
jgi:hypothetical protein